VARYAALALTWPAAAIGELRFDPYASSQYEYQSNVFSVANRQQAVAQNGDPQRDDSLLRYLAGLDAIYEWSRQKLSATVEGRRFDYQHFNQLNHNEYLLYTTLDWMLGNRIDGTLSARQDRRMAAFADRTSSQLAMERERAISAKLGALAARDWRVEVGAMRRDLASPLPGFQSFSLAENSGTLGLKYLGISRFSAGIETTYLDGQYRGITDAPRFNEVTAQGTALYIVSGLSRLDAAVGFTQRKDRGPNDMKTTGLTGNLGYVRTLSGKTDVSLQAYRRVSSYTAGATSTVDTGATLAANWQATPKLAISLNYEWTRSSFQGQAVPGSGIADRRDRLQNSGARLVYQPTVWLSIRPYASYQDRHSNYDLAGYNGAVAGIEVRMRF
jgi:hypothetical protein